MSKENHEIIGKAIKVVHADNKCLIGITGTVINETRNTLELDNGKTLIKQGLTLTMNINNKVITIDGNTLSGRPENRLKKETP
ncbi:MAG TPA: ribonuclease P protein subunit [Candidatus Nanoarchaeia archaeon]|nr:ribonuclease P protein subunit [Candidatus Nanoarchaeia archaeon]